jgi:hypothetical protein
LDRPAARRFRGIFCPGGEPPAGRRHGLRFEGSLDELVAGLRALGATLIVEPLENGLPTPDALGAIRTWGSPWVDCLETNESTRLTDELAAALSRATGRRALRYQYDFSGGRFTHTLYAAGDAQERLDRTAPVAEVLAELEAKLAGWKMRDWGFGVDDLEAGRVPFPPDVVVEAGFLRIGTPSRSRFIRAAALAKAAKGDA